LRWKEIGLFAIEWLPIYTISQEISVEYSMRVNRSTRVVLVFFGALLGALLFSAAFAADPPPVVQSEVAHLFDYVENSGCQFYRNGSWHDAHQARSHLELKYRYLCKKGQVSCTEDVIEHAASVSSISGKPYQIKCGDAGPVPSRDWLNTELKRFRLQDKKS
jgi:hypothetical protein